MAKDIRIDVSEVPEKQRYRTEYGELSHYVTVVLGGGMCIPVAHAPARELAEVAAAALQRWADEDPEGLYIAMWTARIR
ncbi:hypothetical protein MOQ72_41465 [Saccharopolyspora sp. K220]|uniref:hypothetical protein n=1 Tax=Saccharopolyspora soli TaxID=2926618 RepID=UPI001F5972E0|nr:hypothetical protein [Saccharopolyspora soli]MCI2423889.1 hypothetical protein [Saccharopolyspora soli]